MNSICKKVLSVLLMLGTIPSVYAIDKTSLYEFLYAKPDESTEGFKEAIKISEAAPKVARPAGYDELLELSSQVLLNPAYKTKYDEFIQQGVENPNQEILNYIASKQSLFDFLGVDKSATDEDVQKAIRSKYMVTLPEEQQKLLDLADKVFSNPTYKKEYIKLLDEVGIDQNEEITQFIAREEKKRQAIEAEKKELENWSTLKKPVEDTLNNIIQEDPTTAGNRLSDLENQIQTQPEYQYQRFMPEWLALMSGAWLELLPNIFLQQDLLVGIKLATSIVPRYIANDQTIEQAATTPFKEGQMYEFRGNIKAIVQKIVDQKLSIRRAADEILKKSMTEQLINELLGYINAEIILNKSLPDLSIFISPQRQRIIATLTTFALNQAIALNDELAETIYESALEVGVAWTQQFKFNFPQQTDIQEKIDLLKKTKEDFKTFKQTKANAPLLLQQIKLTPTREGLNQLYTYAQQVYVNPINLTSYPYLEADELETILGIATDIAAKTDFATADNILTEAQDKLNAWMEANRIPPDIKWKQLLINLINLNREAQARAEKEKQVAEEAVKQKIKEEAAVEQTRKEIEEMGKKRKKEKVLQEKIDQLKSSYQQGLALFKENKLGEAKSLIEQAINQEQQWILEGQLSPDWDQQNILERLQTLIVQKEQQIAAQEQKELQKQLEEIGKPKIIEPEQALDALAQRLQELEAAILQ